MTVNSIDRQKTELKDRIALALGIASTMPIVGIPFGGRYITVFTFVFILFFGMSLIKSITGRKFTFQINDLKHVYLLFLVWPIISYIVGLIYMPGEWHSSMTTYVIRALEYLVLTVILYIEDNKTTSIYFIKGLLAGIVANAIWSIFEAVSFYFFRQSLNDMVFGPFLTLNRSILLWNRLGGIRVSGLNYDPAHLGGILPILFCYALMKKNWYLIILTLLSLAFSQSTTALAGCAVVLLFFIFFSHKKKEWSTRKRVTYKGVISAFIGIALVVIVFGFLGTNGTLASFFDSINENISGYIKRINTYYVVSNNVGPREVYYTQFIDGLIERGPLVSAIGSGLGTSMYPFRNVSGLFASGSQSTVTEIETNYIAYLFDLGIIGLSFYIVFLIKGFMKMWQISKTNNEPVIYIYLGVFISIICCSALYHYIFTSYQMLAFTFATIYIDHAERNRSLEGPT